MNRFFKAIALAGIAAMVTGTAGLAQTRVDAKKDWSVFVAGDGGSKVCWIVSQPTNSTATRGGNAVEVRRGDIFLMVSARKADKVENEVSFLAGYPFRKGSKVKVSVGSNNYTMFTDGENAWTPSSRDDGALTTAFRRGATARIEGVSGRGTTTVDTFSLSGFTAALKDAQTRCK
ncbi:MAG: invasion associated locus B family protein [Pseudomonadota bacterium]